MRPRPFTARIATAAAALALAASGVVGTAASSEAATPTYAQQVVTLVNAQRAKVGCRALRVDVRLQRAAFAHSVDMAKRRYFSHTSLDGRTFVDRIRAQGYTGRRLGENIAAGYRTPIAVMSAWMKSPGHRANILDCRYTAIGVGVATGGPYGIYWTQDFGG
ncbi:CAP domain-containing protein [Intrasporangium flavum]|uniref:CAP domain-containing protein n=1 Tax=Intrasporangium flavum TaxID=1428657 RepID=UPI00096F2092|nr:CAP domain-containing protein [Intrasporangium flavum]